MTVSVLAATAALVQPRAGRALDAGRLSARTGIGLGLALAAAGLGCGALPGLAGVLLAAVLIGTGTGVITRWRSLPSPPRPARPGSVRR